MSHLYPSPVAALALLGDPTTDGEFIVATGAGAFAYESGTIARLSLGLAIGTDVQAFDAHLEDLAALSPVSGADEVMVSTGAGTWAFESGATLHTSLGLSIGSDVQAFDAHLEDLAALSPVGGASEFMVSTGAGAWQFESGATVRSSLGLAIGTDVQAQDVLLQDIADITTPGQTFTAADQFIVSTGVGAAELKSGSAARDALSLGTSDSPQFTGLNITGTAQIDTLLVTTQVIAHTEEMIVDDNTILFNSGHIAVSDQDFGILGIKTATGTTDTVVSYDSASTLTTSGSGTYSPNDYFYLDASGVNDGLYRVLSHVGTTLTIATTGDDSDAIKTSLDTGETDFGTTNGVEVAGLRYDGSADTWEFATAASTGPLVYTSIDSGLLVGNNTWTGTQDFTNTVTTDGVQRNCKTKNAAYAIDSGVTEDHIILCDDGAGDYTITLPAATGSGRELVIKRIGATDKPTIDADSTETIDGSLTKTLNSRYSSVTLIDCAAGEWSII